MQELRQIEGRCACTRKRTAGPSTTAAKAPPSLRMTISIAGPVSLELLSSKAGLFRSGVFCGAYVGLGQLVSFRDAIQLCIGEMLDVDHLIFCRADGVDQLVEFQVDGAGVAVLRVLDEEDHQERNNGRAGIDEELPGVGVVVDGPRNTPDEDDANRRGKGPLRAETGGREVGKVGETVFRVDRFIFARHWI